MQEVVILAEPTKRQMYVLQAIQDFIENYGYPPTIRDVAGMCEMSANGVYYHIRALERHKLITRVNDKARSIQLQSVQEKYTNLQQLYNTVSHARHSAAGLEELSSLLTKLQKSPVREPAEWKDFLMEECQTEGGTDE